MDQRRAGSPSSMSGDGVPALAKLAGHTLRTEIGLHSTIRFVSGANNDTGKSV